jgi:hypothetical protein
MSSFLLDISGSANLPYKIYESYSDITIQTQKDKLNRQYFFFKDAFDGKLVCVVFRSLAGQMISVNNVVVPLERFLKISEMLAKEAYDHHDEEHESQILDIHQIGNKNDILCLSKGDVVLVPNTTVPLVMMALTTLMMEFESSFTTKHTTFLQRLRSTCLPLFC